MTATQTYHVTGMTCQHCAHAVTEELTKLDGVNSVEVGLVPDGESAVTVTSQSPLAERMIAVALNEVGDYRLAGH